MRTRARALTVLFAAALIIVGCDGGAEPVDRGSLDVAVRSDADNALRAEVSFPNDERVAPSVEVSDQTGGGFRLTAPIPAGETQVVPLLGLTPGTRYSVKVTVGETSGSASFTTGELPDDMPPIEVDTEPANMTAGLTLFNVIPLQLGETEAEPTEDGYLVAVDQTGEVVWYHRQTHSIQDVRRTDSGELLYIHFETCVKRLDVLEGSVTEWTGTSALESATEDEHGRPYAGGDAIRVETDQMHHEVIEVPNGNLITLSREVEEVAGFTEPICDETDDFEGSYQVAADTIVEFEPANGTVVKEWSLFDLVDPLDYLDRIRPAEFCGQYLADVYPELEARDWTHANAVVLDGARNALLVSARHLDQILAIRYEDDENGPAGELMWRLGEGGDFELTSGEWFLHQHAPQVLDDGTIMIYDNGNERPGTSLEDLDNLPYSRAVQYRIDTDDWTAEQVWEHRADAPGEAVYAPFVGDADMLDGGTVLVTHGGLLDPPAHSPQTEGVVAWGRVIEVDYETGAVVFDLQVKDPAGEKGWIVYRSERIPSIYPDGYGVESIAG